MFTPNSCIFFPTNSFENCDELIIKPGDEKLFTANVPSLLFDRFILDLQIILW